MYKIWVIKVIDQRIRVAAPKPQTRSLQHLFPLRISDDTSAIQLIEVVVTQLKTGFHHTTFSPLIPTGKKEKRLSHEATLIHEIHSTNHLQHSLRPFTESVASMINKQRPPSVPTTCGVVKIGHHSGKNRHTTSRTNKQLLITTCLFVSPGDVIHH